MKETREQRDKVHKVCKETEISLYKLCILGHNVPMSLFELSRFDNLTMKQSDNHNLWHHLVMVVYSEMINLVWFLVGIVLALGGLAIFKFAKDEFFRIAVGMPVISVGISIGIIKLHEIILVVTRPKRLKAICIFCQPSFKLPKKRKDAILEKI